MMEGSSPGTCIVTNEETLAMQAKKNCVVCGDQGTGFHYTVFSCEGCKGFFKRHLAKNTNFGRCKSSQNCVVDKASRSKCPACRLAKCVAMGMKKEDKISSQKKVKQAADSAARNSASSTPILSTGVMDELIQVVIDSDPFKRPCPPTGDEAARGLRSFTSYVESLSQFVPMNAAPPMPDLTPAEEAPSHNSIITMAYNEVHLIVKWSKLIPGFKELPLDSRITLLRNSFIDLSILRLVYRSMEAEEGYLKFSEDLLLCEEDTSRMGLGGILHTLTIDMVSKIKAIGIDSTEFALLNTLVLLYPDCIGLMCADVVRAEQKKYLDALEYYVKKTYPQQPSRYSKILLRLPALRSISVRASSWYMDIVVSESHQINALVAELFSMTQ